MSQVNFSEITNYLQSLQKNICTVLTDFDGEESFLFDRWDKSGSKGLQGYGISAVIKNGGVFEKGGVNFSCVEGEKLPGSASANRGEIANKPFKAAGVSLVLHPENPYMPTTHANVRFFCAGEENPVWWFGGGYDLTPYYGFDEDCKHWHQTAKNACDPYGPEIYPKYKKWCDEYFYLKHRDEHRGVGGLFFDDLNDWGYDKSFAFMKSIGDSFLDAYLPIAERRKNTPYGKRERDFQIQRRGRYVEFNLVYDRGTLFGLQSGGRTEAILMSMPPLVSWDYCASYPEDSEEHRLTSHYLKTREWV